MLKAFVLTTIEAGEAKEACKLIKKIDAVKDAFITFGPYDIIVTIEAEHLSDIGYLVANKIQLIPGVLRTLTCLTVD